MDIGTGVFLGAVFFSVIILYISTRDRWRWRKIAKWSGIFFVAAGLVTWAGLSAIDFYKNRAVLVYAYQGIQLSDSKSDIRFKKGEPTEINKIVWGYQSSDKQWDTIIIFNGEKIRAILYGGNCAYCNNLNGIGIGTNYEAVIEKLGQPTFVSNSKDGLMRFLSFKNTGMAIRMSMGKVDAVGIYNPLIGPPEFVNH